MKATIYGIRNCDTMKKARAWLDAHDIPYTFHDYRKDGVDPARLIRWCRASSWEQLLNRAGTTFRKLPETSKTGLDERTAVELMLAHPSMIKRPVLELDSRIVVGFAPDKYQREVLGHD